MAVRGSKSTVAVALSATSRGTALRRAFFLPATTGAQQKAGTVRHLKFLFVPNVNPAI